MCTKQRDAPAGSTAQAAEVMTCVSACRPAPPMLPGFSRAMWSCRRREGRPYLTRESGPDQLTPLTSSLLRSQLIAALTLNS